MSAADAAGDSRATSGSAVPPPPSLARPVLASALRLGLGLLMAYAGAIKLLEPPATFAEEIGNYRLLPMLAPLAAVTLPAVEVVAGLALILLRGGWRRGAALLNLGLLLVFTAAVASARVRGIDLRCGCFGGDSGPVTNLTVVRDVALSAWAAVVLWQARSAERAPTAPATTEA